MDETEMWLKDNDPEYCDRKGKDYPYHSRRQSFLRSQKEIPVSGFIGRRDSIRIPLGDGNYKTDIKEHPNRVINYFD